MLKIRKYIFKKFYSLTNCDYSYQPFMGDFDLSLSVVGEEKHIICRDFGIHREVTDAVCEYHTVKKVILQNLDDSLDHPTVVDMTSLRSER